MGHTTTIAGSSGNLFLIGDNIGFFPNSRQGGGGTEMPNIGWGGGVRSDPEKKIVTTPKLGLFLGRKAQEACRSIRL